jgi:hypothetical protein
VIFPEIPPAETGVLDIVHSNVKAQFVHDGREPEKLEDYEKPLIDLYRRAKAKFIQ